MFTYPSRLDAVRAARTQSERDVCELEFFRLPTGGWTWRVAMQWLTDADVATLPDGGSSDQMAA